MAGLHQQERLRVSSTTAAAETIAETTSIAHAEKQDVDDAERSSGVTEPLFCNRHVRDNKMATETDR
jgi:hypothetical protein